PDFGPGQNQNLTSQELHPNLWAPCAPGERGLSPTPRGAEGWPPRAGSASRHASPAGGVWTEQHLQEGEGEEEEEEEEEGPRWRKKTAPRGSPCGPSSAFGKHPRPGSRGAGSDRRTDGGEEEMERARQVGAHCVKAALPVEGSIEAAQRQRHASRGAQGRTHTQIHRHISKESIASAPRLGPRRPQRSLRRRARLLGRAQWRRGRESASRWRALCRAARGERTDHKKKCAVAACNPPSRLVFSMRGPQKSRPTWDA
ncbi:unnamed protein product, partial [Prorocentrum cordatum]